MYSTTASRASVTCGANDGISVGLSILIADDAAGATGNAMSLELALVRGEL